MQQLNSVLVVLLCLPVVYALPTAYPDGGRTEPAAGSRCESHPSRAFGTHKEPLDDSRITIVIPTADGKFCPGVEYGMKVFYGEARRSFVTVDHGYIADNGEPHPCGGRRATFKEQLGYHNLTWTAPKFEDSVMFRVTSANDSMGNFLQTAAVFLKSENCEEEVELGSLPKVGQEQPKEKVKAMDKENENGTVTGKEKRKEKGKEKGKPKRNWKGGAKKEGKHRKTPKSQISEGSSRAVVENEETQEVVLNEGAPVGEDAVSVEFAGDEDVTDPPAENGSGLENALMKNKKCQCRCQCQCPL